MPGAEAAIEEEMVFNGGDERAAKAVVLENTDTGMAEITARVEEAIAGSIKAA